MMKEKITIVKDLKTTSATQGYLNVHWFEQQNFTIAPD